MEQYLAFPSLRPQPPFGGWQEPIPIRELHDLELAERLQAFWLVQGQVWFSGLNQFGDLAFITHPELTRGAAARIVDLFQQWYDEQRRPFPMVPGGWAAQALHFQIDPQFGPPLFEYALAVAPSAPGEPNLELLRTLDWFATDRARRGAL